MAKLQWAILGTGSIARAFAKGLAASDSGTLAWTGSRSPESGSRFAAEFGGQHGSYDEVIQKPDVDAVYIALPHHLHEEWTIGCAREGKAILCEKPFTLDYPSAERALAEVERCGVFFMEAFMYRSTRQTQLIKDVIIDGRIGSLIHVTTEFGFAAPYPWGGFRAVNALGGGALMDVGCYCVSMTLLAAQEDPLRAQYAYAPTAEGYDRLGAGILDFPSGLTASFRTAVHHSLPNAAEFWGEEGRMVVKNPWFGAGTVEFWNASGTEKKEEIVTELGGDLYGIEADNVARFLDDKESPAMPLEDTRRVMRTLDALRASSGFIFDPIGEDIR